MGLISDFDNANAPLILSHGDSGFVRLVDHVFATNDGGVAFVLILYMDDQPAPPQKAFIGKHISDLSVSDKEIRFLGGGEQVIIRKATSSEIDDNKEFLDQWNREVDAGGLTRDTAGDSIENSFGGKFLDRDG